MLRLHDGVFFVQNQKRYDIILARFKQKCIVYHRRQTYTVMTREKFKLIHSELIMQVQLIENDLKLIYAGMLEGDFEENLDVVEKANLGATIMKLKNLDYSDGKPNLTNRDYQLLEQIREIRNYWCHQCYLDYVYISDDYQREMAFQRIAKRLSDDENRTWNLHEHLEQLRHKMLRKYRG